MHQVMTFVYQVIYLNVKINKNKRDGKLVKFLLIIFTIHVADKEEKNSLLSK